MPLIIMFLSCSACSLTSFLLRLFHLLNKRCTGAGGEVYSYISMLVIPNTWLMNTTLIAYSHSADTILFFQSWLMAAPTDARKPVPMLMLSAPRSSEATSPRPSAIHPPATTGRRFPSTSTTRGMRETALMFAQRPPDSFPCAIKAPTPSSAA
jgi:hypothetical protein